MKNRWIYRSVAFLAVFTLTVTGIAIATATAEPAKVPVSSQTNNEIYTEQCFKVDVTDAFKEASGDLAEDWDNCPGTVAVTSVTVKAGTETYQESNDCFTIGYEGSKWWVAENWEDDNKGPECKDISWYEICGECVYELCTEMTEWVLVETGDWQWDPIAQDFYRILKYERYDKYDQDYLCDKKQEKEWQGYQLCTEMTEWSEWKVIQDWTWDPVQGDFYRELERYRYDAYDTDYLCDTEQKTEWKGYEPGACYAVDAPKTELPTEGREITTCATGEGDTARLVIYSTGEAVGDEVQVTDGKACFTARFHPDTKYQIQYKTGDGEWSSSGCIFSFGKEEEERDHIRGDLYLRKTVVAPCGTIAATVNHYEESNDWRMRWIARIYHLSDLRTVEGALFDKTCAAYGGPEEEVGVQGAAFKAHLTSPDGEAIYRSEYFSADGYDGVAGATVWNDNVGKSFGALAAEFPPLSINGYFIQSPFDWLAETYNASWEVEVVEGTPMKNNTGLVCPRVQRGQGVYCGWLRNTLVLEEEEIKEPDASLGSLYPYPGELIGEVCVAGRCNPLYEGSDFTGDGRLDLPAYGWAVYNGHIRGHRMGVGATLAEGVTVTVTSQGNSLTRLTGAKETRSYAEHLNGTGLLTDIGTCYWWLGQWAGIQNFPLE
ncbi:MAG: hypothetical protein U9M98_02605 [Patescibacteria group bacterium]|nr:hypothetical protein [Patescibacteria group bacterium]